MTYPVVFMFSGQGSQYYHMGKELYEENKRFREWMDYFDRLSYPMLGESLIDIIYRTGRRDESFDRLLYTNPALFSFQYSMARLLMEMQIRPDFLLGYSLGEITAASVSGAIAPEQAIRLVIDGARIVENNTEPAAMLAVVDTDGVLAGRPDVMEGCRVTANNFNGNFVVCGPAEAVRRFETVLKREHVIHQHLPVNYGFHTELIEPAGMTFRRLAVEIREPSIPVVSAYAVGPVQQITLEYLWNVIRHPVDFSGTVRSMTRDGDYHFIDVGPSGTLATFVKYILPRGSRSVHFEAINPFGKDLRSLSALEGQLRVGLTA